MHHTTARVVATAITLSVATWVAAQSEAAQAFEPLSAPGHLEVRTSSTSLDSLFIHSTRGNYAQESMEGFRVQIYSGSGVASKGEAQNAQAKFLHSFPATKVYVIYNAPFWRVRVGDFRTRSEAIQMLNRVRGSFAGSYIVRDNTVRKSSFRD